MERARRATGATLQAAEAALADGVAANLGGGTHHAFADAGRGFCVFNDVVAATGGLLPRVRRVLVVDLDVHQGDGTHAAARGRRGRVHVLGQRLSQLPVSPRPGRPRARPSGRHGRRSLPGRGRAAPAAGDRAAPGRSSCFYLAGADPYEGDRLGRLALSRAGLAARDRLVRDSLAAAGVPVCVTLAGGYAEPIEDTVAINLETIRTFAGDLAAPRSRK